MDGEQAEDRARVGGRDGSVALVSCVGADGTGASRSLDTIYQALGGRARYLVTSRASKPPDRLAPYQEYVPSDRLTQALREVGLVVDDGTGQLGYRVPCERPTLRSVRIHSRDVDRMVSEEPDRPRVFTSRTLARHYFRQMRPGDRVIYNGVRTLDGMPEKEHRLTVLCCRLSGHRGVRQILEQNPRLGRVVVCGTGPQRRDLERQFPEVEFTGWVDPDPWLAKAEVSVHWSGYRVEGFWRAPFEALAQGCAVIANRGGDLGLTMTGKTVYFGPTFAQLGQAWRWMLEHDDHRQRVGQASQRAARLHDERLMQLRWRWLIEQELGRPPSTPQVLVAVSYGHERPDHLRTCLDSLSRQTIPARVVLFHDVSRRADPGLRDRLRDTHPGVEVVEVDYDPAGGTCLSMVRNAVREVVADEEIVWYLDGDCLVPEDAVERISAALTLWPDGLVVSSRRRVPLQHELPGVMLEDCLWRTLPGEPGPAGTDHHTEPAITADIAWWTEASMRNVATGPSKAIRLDHLLSYDERMRGWGGEDNDWSYRSFAEAGCRPLIGPTVFHQEHPRDAGWRESARRNMRLAAGGAAPRAEQQATTSSVVVKQTGRTGQQAAQTVTRVKPAAASTNAPEAVKEGTGAVRATIQRRQREPAKRQGVGLVSAVGTEGGGCQKAIRQLADLFGDQATLICTHRSGTPQHPVTGGARFVRPCCVHENLWDRACVVDEGTGQLGNTINYPGRFIQSVRCANNEMRRAIEKHRESGPTVYTSESLADQYVWLMKPGDRVIANGFEPLPELPEKEYGLTVLHGRLTQKRGVAEILAQNPKLGRVVVCGEGQELDELRRRFPEVEFPGFVDVDEYLARAEVNIHWSNYQVEGFWRGPAEGIAHGCAVICNKKGDVPYWAHRDTLWLAHSIQDLGLGWRHLLTHRDHLKAVCAAGLRLAEFQAGHAVEMKRWEWLIRAEMGEPPDVPKILVGVVHGGGTERRPLLQLCLQALSRQTVPVRVVVLNDLGGPGADPELAAWLRDHYPAGEVVDVRYEGGQGSCVAKVRNALWQAAGDEAVWLWVDGDTVLPEDGCERVAAQLVVEPESVLCFPRQRIRPGTLPAVLTEARIRKEMTLVAEADPAKERTRQSLGHNYAWFERRRAYGLAAGPVRAVRAECAARYNETLSGYGGEDNWWSCEAILERGLKPRVGPTAFHLEHTPQTAGERGPEETERARANRRLVRQAFEFDEAEAFDPVNADPDEGRRELERVLAEERSAGEALDHRYAELTSRLRRPLDVRIMMNHGGVGGAEVAPLTQIAYTDPEMARFRLAVAHPDQVLTPRYEAVGIPVDVVGEDGQALHGADVLDFCLTYPWEGYTLRQPDSVVLTRVVNLRQIDLKPEMVRAVDGVIAVSRAVEQGLRRGPLKDVPHHVVHHAVEVPTLEAIRSGRVAMRRKLGIPRSATVVAWCGRLSAEMKNVPLLRRAIEEMGERLWWLVIGYWLATDRDARREWQQFVGRHQVRWLEDVRPWDVGPHYAAADIGLSTSSSEGFGLAAAEMAAWGLPIVASDSRGIRDVVVSGATGYLTSREDEQALLDRLKMVAEADGRERQALGRAGRELIRARCGPLRAANAHVVTYLESVQSLHRRRQAPSELFTRLDGVAFAEELHEAVGEPPQPPPDVLVPSPTPAPRVVLVSDHPIIGGLHFRSALTLTMLRKSGFMTHLLYEKRPEPGQDLSPFFEALGTPCEVLDSKDFAHALAIRLTELAPDIIHVGYLRQWPSVLVDGPWRTVAWLAGPSMARVIEENRAMMDHVERWVLVAEEMRALLPDDYQDRATVIPNAVIGPWYRRYRDRRAAIRQAMGLGEDELAVLWVGRIHDPRKGTGEVYELAERLPRHRFLMVGRFDREASAHHLAMMQRLPNLLWLPDFRPWDMPAVYPAADVYLQTSWGEGFPLGASEAAAAGLPLILTDVGGSGQLITQDGGGNGHLVERGDLAGMERAIQDLADTGPEERQTKGARSQELMDTRHGFREYLGSYARLYLSLTDSPPEPTGPTAFRRPLRGFQRSMACLVAAAGVTQQELMTLPPVSVRAPDRALSVALVTLRPTVGGIQWMLATLAGYLTRLGVHVRLLFQTSGTDHDLTDFLDLHRIPYDVAPAEDWEAYLDGWLQGFAPDVLQLGWLDPLPSAGLDGPWRKLLLFAGPAARRLLTSAPESAAALDRIVCCCEAMRDQVPQPKQDRCTTIPTVIPHQWFERFRHEGQRFREVLGLPDRPVIGWVGRLADNKSKRWDLLLEVAEQIGHRATFLVVGAFVAGQPAEWEWRRRCRELGNVIWLPDARPWEMPLVTPCFDIGLQTSDHEGLSLSLLEMLATGTPLVATDAGGTRSLIVEGQNGFVVPRGDVGAMVERLTEILDAGPARWAEMGRVSRELAGERFGVDQYVSAYLNVYQPVP